jgi:hypothetical protein
VLEELRNGKIHLSGLALLAHYVTAENADALVAEARGRSKRQIEELIARRFPRPDVPDRIGREPQQLQVRGLAGSTGAPPISNGTAPASHESTRSGAGTNLASRSGRTQPLSESRWAVQFTASAELHRKIERATELLSHAVPNGDLATLFERALDALIEQETKRRLGAGRARKRKPLPEGSRHIPVEIARQVWERDGGQCTFLDTDGRRCSARRFVTFEHLVPFALGGLPTIENLCLRCKAHNLHAAREVFGAEAIHAKCAERKRGNASQLEPTGDDDVVAKVHAALCTMGFREPQARAALAEVRKHGVETELKAMLRAALDTLVRVSSTRKASAG